MAQILLERYDDFTGGLNLRADQFLLAKNESPEMLNVEVDPRGGVFSRGGMQRLHTTAVAGTWAPDRLHSFSGATPTIMLANSTKVYRSTGGDFSTLAFSLGNDIATANSNGASFSNWGDTLYISTGATGVAGYKWQTTNTYATALTASGPTWQALVTPVAGFMPKAEHNIVHANKMFVANTFENGVAYPDRLRWSHEGLPEDWVEKMTTLTSRVAVAESTDLLLCKDSWLFLRRTQFICWLVTIQQTLVLLSYQQHWVVQVATASLLRNKACFFIQRQKVCFTTTVLL
jgi:hypothetical protein